jgi:uncharacterized protein YjbI with pentapeptide repeats
MAKMTREKLLFLYAMGVRDFSRENLSNLDLSDCDLRGSNFTKANMRGVNLQRANLSKTVLSFAQLTNTLVDGAILPSGVKRKAWKGMVYQQKRGGKDA